MLGIRCSDVRDDDVGALVALGDVTDEFEGVGQEKVFTSTRDAQVQRNVVPRVNQGGIELHAFTSFVSRYPLVKLSNGEGLNARLLCADDPKVVVYPSECRHEFGFGDGTFNDVAFVVVVPDGSARVNLNQLDGDVVDLAVFTEVNAMTPAVQARQVNQQLLHELRFAVMRCARYEQGETLA